MVKIQIVFNEKGCTPPAITSVISENSIPRHAEWGTWPQPCLSNNRNKSPRRSVIWNYFKKRDGFLASCNSCGKEFSYKTSLGNLGKHWRRKHGSLSLNTFNQNDENSDEASDNSDDDMKNDSMDKESNSSSTWQHFDISDSDKFLARCKTCKKDITYDSVSELTEHVKEHDEFASDEEKQELDLGDKSYWGKKSRRTSRLWRFFNPVNEGTARCKLCNKNLSYASSISNLKKHFQRAHPNVDLGKPNPCNRKNKVIISTNGQLYEIQTTDDEKDPIQTDEVLLEESLDHDYVDHFETVTAVQPTSSTPGTTQKKTNRPKRPEKRPFKRDIRYSNNKDNSSDDDAPTKKASKTNTIDFFGQYIISLLKDMPKHVSDKLQGEIIKQIITAKTELNTPYSVTLIDKPVTVTLNNSSSKSMPEITVNDVGDIVVRKENSNCQLLKEE